MEGSASPLNPNVITASMSWTFRILLVACLRTQSPAFSRVIPEPSSRTRMREVPPSPSSTSMREAPASRAFSTSSLTTDAGRSTSSPAVAPTVSFMRYGPVRDSPEPRMPMIS